MICLKHIYKAYGNTLVVKNFSLTLGAGQVVCLRGANGSGKSTILQIMAGIAMVDAGLRQLTAKRIGFAGHAQQLLASLTVAQNLNYQAHILDINSSALQAAVELFGVSLFLAKRPGQLSQGMLQRLRLARAFAIQPELLLLDEPQTGLDSAGRAILWQQTQHCLQTGAAVAIASHEDLPDLGIQPTYITLSQVNE